jgi:hypothetical protein
MTRGKNDSDRIRLLLKKVKALADAGDTHERIVAQEKLSSLMKKYKIAKFTEKAKKKRVFKLVNFEDCKTIMVHCILDTNESCQIDGSIQKKELYAAMTDLEYVDVVEKFSHYYPLYIKQKECLLVAFLLKNNLGVSAEQPTEDESQSSAEDIIELMGSISAAPYNKKRLN